MEKQRIQFEVGAKSHVGVQFPTSRASYTEIMLYWLEPFSSLVPKSKTRFLGRNKRTDEVIVVFRSELVIEHSEKQ